MSRVLVTGGSGFVGSAVLPLLLEQGFEVHATTRSRRNQQDVSWHVVDLFDRPAVEDALTRIRPTHLLHLAWITTPGQYLTATENLAWLEASVHLVRTFAAAGGKRCVATGTCLEYDLSEGHLDEASTQLKPTTLYGAAKHAFRGVIETAAPQLNMSFGWGRLFYLFGPREHPDRLVPSVALSLLRDRPARVTDGNQARDYLYVVEAASALATFLRSDVVGSVNIASGEAVRVRDVVDQIAQIIGRPDLVEPGALKAPEEPPLVVAETRRLNEEVGWQPTVALGETLSSTVQWWEATGLKS